jgi:hypothetical protein
VIARLESSRVKPSPRTLERLAAATGMRLRISFEPGPRELNTCLTRSFREPVSRDAATDRDLVGDHLRMGAARTVPKRERASLR